MKIFLAAVVIALLAGPAYAQARQVPKAGEDLGQEAENEIKAEKEAEKAYQKSLGNIPAQKAFFRPVGHRAQRQRAQSALPRILRPSGAKAGGDDELDA